MKLPVFTEVSKKLAIYTLLGLYTMNMVQKLSHTPEIWVSAY